MELQLYAAEEALLKEVVWEGKTYLTTPVIAIVSGVLNGEFIPVSEIANGFGSWNGRPVTLDHPNYEGLYVTANDPAMWERFVIGQLFRVSFEEDRLKGEVFIDPEKAAQTEDGKLLLQRVKAGEKVEVSTAYFRNLDPEPGFYNEIAYEGIARDLKPDHLAILLHSRGACSWADGCGLPRLNQQEEAMPYENEHAARLKDPGQYDEFRRDNDKFGDGIDAIWGLKGNGETTTELQAIRFDKTKYTPDEAKAWLSEHDYDPIAFEPAANEAATNRDEEPKPSYSWWDRFKEGVRGTLFGAAESSLEEQWDAVTGKFYALLDSGQPVGEIGDGYVKSVYPDYIIVERLDGRLFRIAYSEDEDGVTFGDQTEVKMVYEPIGNSEIDSDKETPAEESAVENEEAAEEDEAEDEADEAEEPESETDPEPQAEESETDPEAEDADAEEDDAEEAEDAEEGEVEDEADQEEPPEANESKCQEYVSLIDFVDAHGGPELALNRLKEIAEAREAKRTELVENCLKSPSCAFDRGTLERLPDEALENLAELLQPKANYQGTVKPAKPDVTTSVSRRIDLPPLG